MSGLFVQDMSVQINTFGAEEKPLTCVSHYMSLQITNFWLNNFTFGARKCPYSCLRHDILTKKDGLSRGEIEQVMTSSCNEQIFSKTCLQLF